MKSLTKEGEKKIEDIAARYELSQDSVKSLLDAIIQGNASMAQFNIPELGGHGQWMKGGMTMVGDMSNRSLKITVDALCTELATLVTTEILFEKSEKLDSLDKTEIKSAKPWPSVFGTPTTSGSQNNFRYAYFAQVHRLIIEKDGTRSIYDTKHHQISGVSQQQGSGQSFVLSSHDGPVDISSLTLISEPGTLEQPTPELQYDVVKSSGAKEDNTRQSAPISEDDIFAKIEKLSGLYEKGHITEEEYKTKKSELLARL
ncbi:SHOCT domain-containing protein [Dyadobacter sp. CY345]|uniref:SHOCT domain-containing protein n=1 Tax=Dyadobacter sp. CY345 TaxID=2909335 RepID=UPI001F47876C|nr:SHOCT domain-containing protein [Dyadobacter sp. CY345]MCF2442326.1 SHOCT domain-containing protein [Dyadobacter sp. CY345]